MHFNIHRGKNLHRSGKQNKSRQRYYTAQRYLNLVIMEVLSNDWTDMSIILENQQTEKGNYCCRNKQNKQFMSSNFHLLLNFEVICLLDWNTFE